MTDNRTIELRRLLDERGVEYEETTEYVTTAYFDDKVIRYYGYDGDFSVEVIFPRPYLNNTEWLTPEQAIAATLGSERICELQAEVDDLKGKIRDLCVAEDEDRAACEARIAEMKSLVRDMWHEMVTCPDYATSPCMTDSICERVRNLEIEVN